MPCKYTHLVPSFRLTVTIAPNVAAIVPMVAGRFFALVSLVLRTCNELSVTAVPNIGTI